MTDRGLEQLLHRLSQNLERDQLVQTTVQNLRSALQVDRVVLYYFYSRWKGQVTFEAFSSPEFSIFGSTGPDDCFNAEYAALYQAGRVRAIPDIDREPIQECHRDFLCRLQVKANLAVPVLLPTGLWGLLVAHHCRMPRPWSPDDIVQMQRGALALTQSPAIQTPH